MKNFLIKVGIIILLLLFLGCLSPNYPKLSDFCKKNDGIPGKKIYENNDLSIEIDCEIKNVHHIVSIKDGNVSIRKYVESFKLRLYPKENKSKKQLLDHATIL